MSQADIERDFAKSKESDPRGAAEIAYVLAKLYLDAGDIKQATYYGTESIRLFDKCRMETLEDCAARYVTLAGVALPSYIHQDVVRERLKSLGL